MEKPSSYKAKETPQEKRKNTWKRLSSIAKKSRITKRASKKITTFGKRWIKMAQALWLMRMDTSCGSKRKIPKSSLNIIRILMHNSHSTTLNCVFSVQEKVNGALGILKLSHS